MSNEVMKLNTLRFKLDVYLDWPEGLLEAAGLAGIES